MERHLEEPGLLGESAPMEASSSVSELRLGSVKADLLPSITSPADQPVDSLNIQKREIKKNESFLS